MRSEGGAIVRGAFATHGLVLKGCMGCLGLGVAQGLGVQGCMKKEYSYPLSFELTR